MSIKGTMKITGSSYFAVIALALSLVLHTTTLKAETLDFAIIGDAGLWNASAKLTRDSIARSGIQRTILPGDNLYSGSYEGIWSNWTQLGFLFDVVAIGNHNGGYQQEINYFKMPGEYYSKVYPKLARFIVLNSDDTRNVKEQMAFLEKELMSATEANVFLVYHHPTYTLSGTHRWTEKQSFQLGIRPLIWKYRGIISGIMVGHDHLAMLAHFNDLPVILSGAAKSQRNDGPTNNVQDGVHVTTEWFFDKHPYWTKMTLNSNSNKVDIAFVRSSDDRESCTATIQTGQRAQLGATCGSLQ